MFKEKEKKTSPVVEIGLNIGALVEQFGLDKTLDKVLGLVQEGKVEIRVEIGGKEKKVPANLVLKLIKAGE